MIDMLRSFSGQLSLPIFDSDKTFTLDGTDQYKPVDPTIGQENASGMKTRRSYEKVGDTSYFGSAGFGARTVGLPAGDKSQRRRTEERAYFAQAATGGCCRFQRLRISNFLLLAA
jgi:hypothetical protein